MSRKSFIESVGGTCRNWTWSWSFVNHTDKQVIFGAWDKDTAGGRAMILDEVWVVGASGRKNPGYPEARDHLRLVEEGGYALWTPPSPRSSTGSSTMPT